MTTNILYDISSNSLSSKSVTIFKWFPTLATCCYYCTPFADTIRLYKRTLKVNKLTLFYLLLVLQNAAVYSAFSITSKNIEISVLVCNTFGFLINIISLSVFLYKYFEKRIISFIFFLIFVSMLLICWFFFLIFFIIQKDYIGKIGMVSSFLMYLSPIAHLVFYIKSGELSYFPLYTNIIGCISTSLWMLYGIITYVTDKDKNRIQTIVSNIVYLISCIIQILVWIRYYKKLKKKARLNRKNIKEKNMKENLNENNINE